MKNLQFYILILLSVLKQYKQWFYYSKEFVLTTGEFNYCVKNIKGCEGPCFYRYNNTCNDTYGDVYRSKNCTSHRQNLIDIDFDPNEKAGVYEFH